MIYVASLSPKTLYGAKIDPLRGFAGDARKQLAEDFVAIRRAGRLNPGVHLAEAAAAFADHALPSSETEWFCALVQVVALSS
jgi:hypothetical protein